MNTKDYFKDMYTDFFGVESELNVIDVKSESQTAKNNHEEMTSLFNKINTLYITDSSRDILKKIIEYMRKYQEGIEKQYIPFRLIINGNSNTIIEELVNILYESSKYYKYIDKFQYSTPNEVARKKLYHVSFCQR